MSSIADRGIRARLRDVARDRTLLWVFSLTLLTSAGLLFSVQPMFAKMVLPTLGGTPAVWAVSMCFFQGALLAGYVYAHLLDRHLSSRAGALVHLAVLAVAFLSLPIGLPAALSPPAGDAYGWLLWLLALGVGLPFFAISANAPLLQAWFARSGHPHSSDPYFLYGASNLGSLTALLAYPFLIEPALGLAAQSRYWASGYVALTLLIAACAALVPARGRAAGTTVSPAAAAPSGSDAPPWSRRALWVVLALIPSGLMVAVTTYISTDIASVPLLWVIPLALFLLTFVLVFRERPLLSYRWTNELYPVWVLGVILLPTQLLGTVAALLAFFAGAIVCHRELYLRRPAAAHLTEFYLWMSVGGAAGGVLTALIAPHVFTSTSEFVLLLVAAMACRPGVLLGQQAPLNARRVTQVLLGTVGVLLAYKLGAAYGLLEPSAPVLLVVLALVFVAVFRIRKHPEHRLALVLVMLVAALIQPNVGDTLFVERSFFGTHRVMENADGSVRTLLHGTTVHGAQRLRDGGGAALEAPVPMTYYSPDGPMARAVGVARSHLAERRPESAFRAGVIGLGTGALACQSAPGDLWRYYEIDPTVVRIARDPELFGFLSRCQEGEAEIVLGDARLTLAAEDERFGLLVIDAFSSDSIPIHLLTTEAIESYLDRLDRHGLLALHVSNRHLDLVPSLSSTIASVPGAAAVRVFDERPAGDLDAVSSDVVFVAREPDALAPILAWKGATPVAATGARPWTDDYSDVLSALLAGFRRP